MDREKIYQKAEKKAKEKKDFFTGLATWAVFTIFFIYLDTGFRHFHIGWSFYPIFFWGLGMFIHGLKVFDFFGWGEKWEKEEIKKEIKKRQQYMNEEFDPMDDRLDLDELYEKRGRYKDEDLV